MAEINGRCHWRHTDSQTASALAFFLNDLILALIDISKRESFTKAADDIYVSQSALSKSVKSLEQELNVTLIDRTSKSFNLTE